MTSDLQQLDIPRIYSVAVNQITGFIPAIYLLLVALYFFSLPEQNLPENQTSLHCCLHLLHHVLDIRL